MSINTVEVYKGLKYHEEDYSHRLEISNLGNLRNSITKHIYKPHLNKSTGYLAVYVSLGSRGVGKCIKIHIAVASTFIPNLLNLPVVNHKDGVKTNCIPSNLEWCTHKYNVQHAFRTGLAVPVKGQAHTKTKLSLEDIAYIQKHYKPRDRQYGARALGRKFNVFHTSILLHVQR